MKLRPKIQKLNSIRAYIQTAETLKYLRVAFLNKNFQDKITF